MKTILKKKEPVGKQYSRFHWFPVQNMLPRDYSDTIVTIAMKTKSGAKYFLREFAFYTAKTWDLPNDLERHPDLQGVVAWMYAPNIYKTSKMR